MNINEKEQYNEQEQENDQTENQKFPQDQTIDILQDSSQNLSQNTISNRISYSKYIQKSPLSMQNEEITITQSLNQDVTKSIKKGSFLSRNTNSQSFKHSIFKTLDSTEHNQYSISKKEITSQQEQKYSKYNKQQILLKLHRLNQFSFVSLQIDKYIKGNYDIFRQIMFIDDYEIEDQLYIQNFLKNYQKVEKLVFCEKIGQTYFEESQKFSFQVREGEENIIVNKYRQIDYSVNSDGQQYLIRVVQFIDFEYFTENQKNEQQFHIEESFNILKMYVENYENYSIQDQQIELKEIILVPNAFIIKTGYLMNNYQQINIGQSKNQYIQTEIKQLVQNLSYSLSFRHSIGQYYNYIGLEFIDISGNIAFFKHFVNLGQFASQNNVKLIQKYQLQNIIQLGKVFLQLQLKLHQFSQEAIEQLFYLEYQPSDGFKIYNKAMQILIDKNIQESEEEQEPDFGINQYFESFFCEGSMFQRNDILQYMMDGSMQALQFNQWLSNDQTLREIYMKNDNLYYELIITSDSQQSNIDNPQQQIQQQTRKRSNYNRLNFYYKQHLYEYIGDLVKVKKQSYIRQGYGCLYIDGNLIYEGQWLGDKPDGQGNLYLYNQLFYDEQFYQGALIDYQISYGVFNQMFLQNNIQELQWVSLFSERIMIRDIKEKQERIIKVHIGLNKDIIKQVGVRLRHIFKVKKFEQDQQYVNVIILDFTENLQESKFCYKNFFETEHLKIFCIVDSCQNYQCGQINQFINLQDLGIFIQEFFFNYKRYNGNNKDSLQNYEKKPFIKGSQMYHLDKQINFINLKLIKGGQETIQGIQSKLINFTGNIANVKSLYIEQEIMDNGKITEFDIKKLQHKNINFEWIDNCILQKKCQNLVTLKLTNSLINDDIFRKIIKYFNSLKHQNKLRNINLKNCNQISKKYLQKYLLKSKYKYVNQKLEKLCLAQLQNIDNKLGYKILQLPQLISVNFSKCPNIKNTFLIDIQTIKKKIDYLNLSCTNVIYNLNNDNTIKKSNLQIKELNLQGIRHSLVFVTNSKIAQFSTIVHADYSSLIHQQKYKKLANLQFLNTLYIYVDKFEVSDQQQQGELQEEKTYIEMLKVIKYMIKKKQGVKMEIIDFKFQRKFNTEAFIQSKRDIFIKDIIQVLQILINGIDVTYILDIQNFLNYNNVVLNSYFPFFDQNFSDVNLLYQQQQQQNSGNSSGNNGSNGSNNNNRSNGMMVQKKQNNYLVNFDIFEGNFGNLSSYTNSVYQKCCFNFDLILKNTEVFKPNQINQITKLIIGEQYLNSIFQKLSSRLPKLKHLYILKSIGEKMDCIQYLQELSELQKLTFEFQAPQSILNFMQNNNQQMSLLMIRKIILKKQPIEITQRNILEFQEIFQGLSAIQEKTNYKIDIQMLNIQLEQIDFEKLQILAEIMQNKVFQNVRQLQVEVCNSDLKLHEIQIIEQQISRLDCLELLNIKFTNVKCKYQSNISQEQLDNNYPFKFMFNEGYHRKKFKNLSQFGFELENVSILESSKQEALFYQDFLRFTYYLKYNLTSFRLNFSNQLLNKNIWQSLYQNIMEIIQKMQNLKELFIVFAYFKVKSYLEKYLDNKYLRQQLQSLTICLNEKGEIKQQDIQIQKELKLYNQLKKIDIDLEVQKNSLSGQQLILSVTQSQQLQQKIYNQVKQQVQIVQRQVTYTNQQDARQQLSQQFS